MHNWKNLDLFLTLDAEYQNNKLFLTKELIEACETAKVRKVKRLLSEGVYVNSFDELQTPLMATVEAGHIDLAAFLISIGAQPNLQIKDSDALWLALRRQRHNFLRLFFQKKWNLNREKETGKTLLIVAVEMSDLEAVEIIAPKVNVNERDNTGSIALHYNLAKINPSEQDIQIGRILIACGADINSRNLDGQKAKDLAATEQSRIVLEQAHLEQTLKKAPEPVHDNTLDNDKSGAVEVKPKKKYKI